jgi:hypothetical protein
VAITNGYCTLSELKDSLQIDDSVDNASLEAAIMSASRMIDDYTQRFFYKDGTVGSPVARYYTPEDAISLNIDDIVSITSVATDNDLEFTYTTVWATSDFVVEPINNPRKGWPYNRLVAVGAYVWPFQIPQSVKITGAWGWSSVPQEIQLATKIQASRLFIRRQSPFGIAGSPELGTVRLSSRLDPDVEALIRPFKKVRGLAY